MSDARLRSAERSAAAAPSHEARLKQLHERLRAGGACDRCKGKKTDGYCAKHNMPPYECGDCSLARACPACRGTGGYWLSRIELAAFCDDLAAREAMGWSFCTYKERPTDWYPAEIFERAGTSWGTIPAAIPTASGLGQQNGWTGSARDEQGREWIAPSFKEWVRALQGWGHEVATCAGLAAAWRALPVWEGIYQSNKPRTALEAATVAFHHPENTTLKARVRGECNLAAMAGTHAHFLLWYIAACAATFEPGVDPLTSVLESAALLESNKVAGGTNSIHEAVQQALIEHALGDL